MDEPKPLTSAFTKTANFSIHEVDEVFRDAAQPAAGAAARAARPPVTLPPILGPLSAFTGTFTGQGFNTIFRPDSKITPTPMPGPISTTDPDDNVLELNSTDETMSFSNNLGSIPNRGSLQQADAFLNGVPYLQTINDITTGTPVGIHFEPGIWLAVPATTNPHEPFTVARMASIPHGTTPPPLRGHCRVECAEEAAESGLRRSDCALVGRGIGANGCTYELRRDQRGAPRRRGSLATAGRCPRLIEGPLLRRYPCAIAH